MSAKGRSNVESGNRMSYRVPLLSIVQESEERILLTSDVYVVSATALPCI